MAITKKEVEHVAELSRLTLSEQEILSYTEQMNGILTFIEKLNEIDTEKVEPTSQALSIHNVYRKDHARDSLPRELALKNAPEQKDGQFKVPQVMEG